MEENLSYEKYMNLPQYPSHWKHAVPHEISKKVIYNTLSPCICIQTNEKLDKHLMEVFKVDSLSMLFRYFGDYIQDRDQISNMTNAEGITGNRQRSGSLFQRQASECVRFTSSLEDLISLDSETQMLKSSDIESFLSEYLNKIECIIEDSEKPSPLLKHSMYHKFFVALSSINLSRYHTFHHPVVALLPIDVTLNQDYEFAREILIQFKNLNNSLENFPSFLNINDILPVFLLCYDENSREEWEAVQSLSKALKKQLFVESISLPLFTCYSNTEKTTLHPPISISLHEQIYSMSHPVSIVLSTRLVSMMYDIISRIVQELMIPFMHRKILFWDESVLQPRRSIFQSKFLRRFMNKNNQNAPNKTSNSSVDDNTSTVQFNSTSSDFSLRKLADWSFMLSDFKASYSIYELLSKDWEAYPDYLAPCLESRAVSLLMGAQNIITAKMIKTEIEPLIAKAIHQYQLKREPNPLRLVHCILTCADLLLSLSDTWVSSPLAIGFLNRILDSSLVGPHATVLLCERISYAYELCIDPRVNDEHILHRNYQKVVYHQDNEDLKKTDNIHRPSVRTEGLTRFRKSSLFQLLAAKKWTELNKKNQARWCLQQVHQVYDKMNICTRAESLYSRLAVQLNQKEA